MTTLDLFLYCATMAIVTYLIRMLPLVLINKKIENEFIKSFLYYIPYAVLAAMVIPEIFFVTGSTWSAIIGFVVAVLLSYFGKSLITVAVFTCLSVYIADTIINLL